MEQLDQRGVERLALCVCVVDDGSVAMVGAVFSATEMG